MAVGNIPVLPQSGGYEYKFLVDEVPERFICLVCTKVLRDPHLTEVCGQHFCETCLQQWFRKQGREVCPHCRSEGKKFVHITNRALKREIDDLKIYCTNHKVGCKWVGELCTLKTHLESEKGCDYIEVNCTNKCKAHVKRKDLADHLTQHCPLRKYKCQHCGEENTYQIITERHYGMCPNYPLDCPNGCGARKMKQAEMRQHRHICPQELVECPNSCKCTAEIPSGIGFIQRVMLIMQAGQASKTQLRRKDLDDHLTHHCPLRQYKCQHCRKEDTYQTITERHYDKCPNYPLDCPDKCGAGGIKRAEMGLHRSMCPLEPVECPFKEAGCQVKLARREFDRHMATNQQQHLLTLMGAFREAKAELGATKKELSLVKRELRVVKSQLTAQDHLHTTRHS